MEWWAKIAVDAQRQELTAEQRIVVLVIDAVGLGAACPSGDAQRLMTIAQMHLSF